jgi:hypothetical protein
MEAGTRTLQRDRPVHDAIANPRIFRGTFAGTSPAAGTPAPDAFLHTRRAPRRGSSDGRALPVRRDHTFFPMAHRARPLVFFSFDESDRWTVWRIRNLASDRDYPDLDFDVADLQLRWAGATPAERGRAIASATLSCTHTVVLVGERSHASEWVAAEVAASIESGRPVIAMRLPDTSGLVPDCLTTRGIAVHDWDEATLQRLMDGPTSD